MNLDISFDPDAEEINLIFDNHLLITAHRDTNDDIVFSKSMGKIDDDDTYNTVHKICTMILNMGK
jgi:hypothetical protein